MDPKENQSDLLGEMEESKNQIPHDKERSGNSFDEQQHVNYAKRDKKCIIFFLNEVFKLVSYMV
jgi:Zn-finger nucleic acid-binding protein